MGPLSDRANELDYKKWYIEVTGDQLYSLREIEDKIINGEIKTNTKVRKKPDLDSAYNISSEFKEAGSIHDLKYIFDKLLHT